MSRRRRAREAAMQILFQADFDREADPSEIRKRFWEDHPADAETRAFADDLVEGATAHREEIDELLRRISEHWSVSRMSPSTEPDPVASTNCSTGRLVEGRDQRGHRNRQALRDGVGRVQQDLDRVSRDTHVGRWAEEVGG
jgi:hypothetical protein